MEVRNSQDTSRSWHLVALLTALAGLCIAFYSIYHYRLVTSLGQSGAFCNINATVNCDAIAASSYSRFLTIPWGVWGAGYFFTVLLLLTFSFNKMGNRQEHLLAYSLCAVAGILVSITLAFISMKVLGITCLICVSIYLVNLIQGALLWWALKSKLIVLKTLQFKNLYSGLVTTVLGFAAVLITYNIIGEQDIVKVKTLPHNEPTLAQTLPTVTPIENIPISVSEYSGLGEDYRKGPDNAKLQIILFSDFECPGCKIFSQTLEEAFQSYPGKILLVYRNYPLDQACNPIMTQKMHEHACQLALIARCAGRYGKFWPYHDLAFAKQSELNASSPKQWAKDVGLTETQIKDCLADKNLELKLKEDIDLGTQLHLEHTPTIFLNGRRFLGKLPELKDEIKMIVE